MPSLTVMVLGFAGAAYLVVVTLLHLTQDSKEPPVIATCLPFISPLIGQVRGMTQFLVRLRLVVPYFR
jgi:hypothetical protein